MYEPLGKMLPIRVTMLIIHQLSIAHLITIQHNE